MVWPSACSRLAFRRLRGLGVKVEAVMLQDSLIVAVGLCEDPTRSRLKRGLPRKIASVALSRLIGASSKGSGFALETS